MWTHGKPMNDMPFEHVSHNGTVFKCSRCDFKEPIYVSQPDESFWLNKLMVDISEMIGYHAMNIWNQLNGFQGYDTIEYKIVKGKK